MKKLVAALAFFLAWAGWTLATGGRGIAAFLWFPLIGAAVTVQLMVFKLIAGRLGDR